MDKLPKAIAASLWLAGLLALPAMAEPASPDPAATQEAERLAAMPPVQPKGKAPTDHSGRKEKGRASYYADGFSGRKMANGRTMNPQDNVAASKTLPLGTTAK